MEQELQWEIGKTYRMRRGAGIKSAFIYESACAVEIQQKIFAFYGYKHFTVEVVDSEGTVELTSLGELTCDSFYQSELKYFEEVPMKKPVVDDLESAIDALADKEKEQLDRDLLTGIVDGLDNREKGAELRNLLHAAIQTMNFHLNVNYEKVDIKSVAQLEKFLRRKVKAKLRNTEDNIKGYEKTIDHNTKLAGDAKKDSDLLRSVL